MPGDILSTAEIQPREERESVWKRLTRLFRSGPVVRHKIAAGEKFIEPRGTAQAYKKELSSLYVHSLASYGQYERLSRYADYCFAPDTVIYTVNNGPMTIEELSKKYSSGERFQVYSYDHSKKKVVIADAHSARLAHEGKTERVIELKLDDGGTICLTRDHRVLMRDGSEKFAADITSGDSLMPFYRKDLIGQGYQWIYTMDRSRSKNGWELEHRLVSEYVIGRQLLDNEVVHHRDFDRSNNLPTNLDVLSDHEHQSYHATLNNKNKLGKPNQKHSDWMRAGGSHRREDVNFASIVRAAIATDYSLQSVCKLLSTDQAAIRLRIRERGFVNWKHFCSLRREIERGVTFEVIKRESSVTWEQLIENHVGCNTVYELSCKIGCTEKSIVRRLNAYGYKNWSEFKTKNDPSSDPFVFKKSSIDVHALNHKVVSVCEVEQSRVYNITVEEFHNVAAGSWTISEDGQRKLSLCFYYQSEMEFTPEIASALDIYADEATAYNEDGQILNVVSSNTEIKKIVETLFFEILNIEFNAWSWTRNLCKYGDFVLFVDASDSNGILNLLPIPINEIEREEGYDKNDPFAVRFRWLTQGNMILENWQVIHFRLLGNDNFLPYGSSVIEPARRIWRQLILIEDAMLVYRIVRSPERRVFKIDVGNVPPGEIDQFMETIKTRLRRNQVVDPSSGRVDLRYNPLSVDEDYFIPVRGDKSSSIETLAGGQFPVRWDTPIPLLDGRVVTIKQLAEEYEAGKENWVHSVQEGTNAFVPGKVVWCGKNYTCDRIHRVWLDDDTYADMAPEHPIVMRDGTKKRADQVKPGESVMPFRTKRALLGKHDYKMIQDPTDDEWKFIHKTIVRPRNNSAIHHIDFDRFNNRPDNLRLMGWRDHVVLHGEHARQNLHTPEMDAKNAKRMTEFNRSERGRALTRERNSVRWDDLSFRSAHSGKNHWNAKKWAAIYDTLTLDDLAEFCVSRGITSFKELVQHSESPLVGCEQYRSCLRHYGIGGWSEFAAARLGIKPRNHQITRVEVLDCVSDDVYCMTVVGPSNEDDRHNFALLSRKLDGTWAEDWDGFFVGNTGDIDDVQYIQNKMFAALKIPKAHLGYEGELGSKATLAQQDVRFARTIERIQRILIAEMNKIAIIHLFLLGYRGDDLVDFELKLSSSSTVSEQQKLELWRTRFEIAGTAQEGMLDRETIYRKIFKMNDDDIEKVREGKRADKLEDLTLEAMTAPPEVTPEGGPEAAAPGGEEAAPEKLPGEEELPATLGGEPAAGEKPAEPAPEESVIHDAVHEKKNKGSEGSAAEVSVSKGKDLFSTSEDPNKLVFGTEKQTASDPYDKRAMKRMITRPFSETKFFEESVKRMSKHEKELSEVMNEVKKMSRKS